MHCKSPNMKLALHWYFVLSFILSAIVAYENFVIMEEKKLLPFVKLVRDNYTVELIPDDITLTDEQTADQCKKSSITVNSPEELFYLQRRCDILEGNLIIGTDYQERIIDLGFIKEIKGDLVLDGNANIFRLVGENLNTIGGTFTLRGTMSLVAIIFPVLRRINIIDWQVVPVLDHLELGSNLEGLQQLIISDSSISDLNVFKGVQELDIFNINNNRFLDIINSDLKRVSKQLRIHANADELVINMSQLESVDNITIRDAAGINLPELTYVNSSMEIIENFCSDLILPKLKRVDGTLGIIGNPSLQNVSYQNLRVIQGGLMIANNSELTNLDFFPNLKQIGGAIHFDGNFITANMPKLKLVKGSAFIRSTADYFDCKRWFTPVNGRAIVRGGKLKCIANERESTIRIGDDGSLIDNDDSPQYDDSPENKDRQENSAMLRSKIRGLLPLTTLLSMYLILF
ncbi:Sporulation-specific protein 22 [Nakaseomyces glabratus]|nr:Sporulation-specific protein 22 [Nakaseomyces glabratus]KTB21822.1 Sporulation-specific protein 22 [Nakaseomyces glabratus]